MTARAILFLTFALLLNVNLAPAQEGKEADQKKFATETLGKAGIKKISTAETPNLAIYTTLPEAKAKVVGDAAEKVIKFTRTALKVDEKEKLWTGKLSVFLFADTREFTTFVRSATQQRVDSKDTFQINVRGDRPMAILVMEGTDKMKDAELTANVSSVIGAAILNSRAGTSSTTGVLPEWLQLGFGKLMVAKAVGGTPLTEYRTKSKALVAGTKSKPSAVRLPDVWGQRSKETDLAAQNLVEYMLYGMEDGKFLTFAKGFKLTEQGMQPAIDEVFMALEWKLEDLNAGWRVWCAKQR